MSKVQPRTTERITSQGLAFLLPGLPDRPIEATFVSSEPGLSLFADMLAGESFILKLEPGVTGEETQKALKADQQLFTSYATWLRQTVRASVLAQSCPEDAYAQEHLGQAYKNTPDFEFSSALSGVVDELELSELQDLCRGDILRFVAEIGSWLNLLAEQGTISQLEQVGPDSIRFSYNLLETESQLYQEINDPGVNRIGRYVEVNVDGDLHLYGDHYLHTLVKVKYYTLEQYHHGVPERIARLINTIPPGVRPAVSIVGGTLVHQDVTRNYLAGKEVHEHRRVWKSDPAVVLFGAYALDGWGGSDELVGALYRGHRFEQTLTRNALGFMSVGIKRLAIDLGLSR